MRSAIKGSPLRIEAVILFCAMLTYFADSAADTTASLFTKMDACSTQPATSVVLACTDVSVSISALVSNDVTELIVNLPKIGDISFLRTTLGKVGSKSYIWRGKGKDPASNAVFSVVGETVVGTVTSHGSMYRLRLAKGGKPVFELLNSKYFVMRESAADAAISFAATSSTTCEEISPPHCATDSPNRIDVMVVYTKAALQKAVTISALEGWLIIAESDTNTSYSNSGVSQRISILYPWFRMVEDSYVEQDLGQDHSALQTTCDEKLDDVHAWREEAKADAVVLITNNEAVLGSSGLAETMLNYQLGGDLFQSQAFAVVQMEQFTAPTYIFAHELGHIMGAQHDGNDSGAFVFSHGHTDTTPTPSCSNWGTIMTGSTCCQIIPYWSNPGANQDSCWEPMGDLAKENNALTLNRTALTVANFRCRSPTPPNVWMKDGWDDTGLEPDPALASAPMYQSPYIWVRNSQDPFFAEAHQHQNPVANQTNYIYVKVHNTTPLATGGGIAAGKLQVLVADASTALSVSNFVPIGLGVDFPALANGSTEIVQVPWTPSHVGHFCLMARWISATDPIIAAATSPIDPYVRLSNNVVWRNVNIIDLETTPDSGAAVFVVRNLEVHKDRFTLQIKPSNPIQGFLSFGEVSFRIDTTLRTAWEKTQFSGTGILEKSGRIYVTSKDGGTIDFILDPKAEGIIEMFFSRRKAREHYLRGNFPIDVIQSNKDGFVGGIRYEIHTDKR